MPASIPVLRSAWSFETCIFAKSCLPCKWQSYAACPNTLGTQERSLHHTELGSPSHYVTAYGWPCSISAQQCCLRTEALKVGGWPKLHERGPKRTPKCLSALIAQVRQAWAWWQSSEYWKASKCVIGAAASPNWKRSRAVTCRWGSVAVVFEVCSGSATVETVVVKEAMLFGVLCWCTDAPVALVSF